MYPDHDLLEKLKVITIDGPAGSGKSTVAKIVATKLGWIYVTTGAIYRSLALLFHEANLKEKDLGNIERFTSFINERYRQESSSGKVFLGEREVSHEIKAPHVSELASLLAQEDSVRKRLLPIQRKVVLNNNGAVVDGRDMGTVVFPDAPLKIFLTASPEERAERRLKELHLNGMKTNINELMKEINERDLRDTNRRIAPLKPAHDAILLDSTKSTQEEIAKIILKYALQKEMIIKKSEI
ncbi:(d)CMP kinase [Fluviispira multicolorata]|uniref:Cytidylate kinase n=1 Tax=Fluviispira multicolorata TaxID=2654512 RepID=A0A833JDI2_9BACT|nr:(d)CMP kinase [Fluviispira multicolorata]KAB8030915.1 (d)CMP kinase [Fluviispira multicolorata]